MELFNTLPNITDVTLIKANQDTVVGDTPFNGLDERITVLALDGDHEFGKGGRDGLIACVQKVLAV